MFKIKVLFFMLIQISCAVFLCAMETASYEQEFEILEKEISDAKESGDEERVKTLDQKMHTLMLAMAEIKPQGVTPPGDEALKATGARGAVDKNKQLTLRTKLDLVFKQFVDVSMISQECSVLVDIMKNSFNQLLKSKSDKKVIYFIEAARLLKCQLQILSVRPALLKHHFSVVVPCLEAHLLHDLYVQILYAIYTQLNKDECESCEDQEISAIRSNLVPLVTDMLCDLLYQKGYINLSRNGCFRTDKRLLIRQHPFYIFSESFLELLINVDPELIELIQRYFYLEHVSKLASKSEGVDVGKKFLSWFEAQAKTLIDDFFKNAIASPNQDLKVWADLFAGKIVLLTRDLRVRFYVADGSLSKSVQDVYFRHSVVIHDPMFGELVLFPQLEGYVLRYESLVFRFLSGQQEPQLDFCAELYTLLTHFRNRVVEVEPTGGYLWLKEKFGFKSKRVGAEKYFLLMKSMAEVLEAIEKVLKPDEGVLRNVIGNMLKPGESSSENNGMMLDLLAKASPYLASAIKRYVQPAGVNPEVPTQIA